MVNKDEYKGYNKKILTS